MFSPLGDSPLSLDSKCPSKLLFPTEQSVVLPGLQWVRMVAKGLSISLAGERQR